MKDLLISRISTTCPQVVGRIHDNGALFSYDKAYLALPTSTPLSLSLPLTDAPYPQESFRPYFEGLLSEGSARPLSPSSVSTVMQHSRRAALWSSACTKRICVKLSA